MPSKELYAARVADGLCGRCGSVPADGKKMCQKCLDKSKKKSKKYRQENREAILEYKKKYRKENRTAILEYKKKRYLENKSKCLCTRCEKNKIVNGYVYCLLCIDRNNHACRQHAAKNREKRIKYYRERRRQLMAENKCIDCAQEKTPEEVNVRCFACAIDHNEKMRMYK